MPSVFISYVRNNSDQVDRLADELRRHGVNVWLDREQIKPGMFWKDAIRQAIQEGDYFIACFSNEYVARRRTYMNTEIGLAIDMLQEIPTDQVWFIPVLLSECKVPNRTIGGGQTLRDLQWEPLYKNWERGTQRILEAMGADRPNILVIDEPIRMELIYIPAGEYLPASEGDFAEDDPADVAEFYIGKYPITNTQYAVFVQAKNYDRPAHWQDGRIPAGKENHPVVYVTWYDAFVFCKWLSQATGREFRTPNEDEWEKAARGGLRIPGPGGALMDNPLPARRYPWGDEFDNSKCNTDESGIGDTTPVGQYSPQGDSPYGVADMAGNVWEWTAPHVLRGGSWSLKRYFAASLYSHDVARPDDRYDSRGFRVVAGLVPEF